MSEQGEIETKAPAKEPLRRYSCGKHGSVDMRNTFTMFVVQLSGESGGLAGEYNYCPLCFGEWAAEKFPLTCEIIEG